MSDETACGCGQALSTSVYLIRGSIYKSCALCSRVAGEHVFHRIIEFGMWHIDNRPGERPYPQSECVKAYRARVAATAPLTGKTNEQIAPLLPTLPASGRRCSALKNETPLTSLDERVIEALEPLRQHAEEELAASHPAGRQRGEGKQKRVVKPEQVATNRFTEAPAVVDTPPEPKRPTVIVRKRGAISYMAEGL